MVGTLRCVFYVNNALRNVHVVRYAGVRHVQLNHGDSDKAHELQPGVPDVRPQLRRRAGRGRPVQRPRDLHRAGLLRDRRPPAGRGRRRGRARGRPSAGSSTRPPGPACTPTPPTARCPIGPEIVAGLIARGCTVVYRPHPYTGRNPELVAAVRSGSWRCSPRTAPRTAPSTSSAPRPSRSGASSTASTPSTPSSPTCRAWSPTSSTPRSLRRRGHGRAASRSSSPRCRSPAAAT